MALRNNAFDIHQGRKSQVSKIVPSRGSQNNLIDHKKLTKTNKRTEISKKLFGGHILENVIRCASRWEVGEATQDLRKSSPSGKFEPRREKSEGSTHQGARVSLDFSSRNQTLISQTTTNTKETRGKTVFLLTCGGAAVLMSSSRGRGAAFL